MPFDNRPAHTRANGQSPTQDDRALDLTVWLLWISFGAIVGGIGGYLATERYAHALELLSPAIVSAYCCAMGTMLRVRS